MDTPAPVALTLNRDERDDLHQAIVHTLGPITELPAELERGDYDHARQLRAEFEDSAALLDALGWNPDDPRAEFPLTLPADRIGRVLGRLQQDAAMIIAAHALDLWHEPPLEAEALTLGRLAHKLLLRLRFPRP